MNKIEEIKKLVKEIDAWKYNGEEMDRILKRLKELLEIKEEK